MTISRAVPVSPVGGAAVTCTEESVPQVRGLVGDRRLGRAACRGLGAAIMVAAFAGSHADAADVRLSGPACASPGAIIEVELIVDPEGATVAGLQALLTFDPSVLRLVSFDEGDAPYVVPIWSSCDELTAKIDVAVGFDPANDQWQSSTSVAKRMRFEVLPAAAACATAELISFREEPLFKTMLTLYGGARLDPDLAPLGPLTLSPPPSIDSPSDMTVVPPAKSDCATPEIVVPQATSACGATPAVSFVRSDGATSLTAPICRINSPVTITWTATDGCGRSVTAAQVISVTGIPADLNADGMVDAYDLAVVLSSWGSTSGVGDVNGDRVADGTDLAMLLSRWTDNVP